MAALVDHPDHQEEPAGDDAVTHHLHDGTLDAQNIEAHQPSIT
jgi:hypothetical protein